MLPCDQSALGSSSVVWTDKGVPKDLKLNVRKVWGLIPTFVEVAGEKLVGRPFWPTPS